MRTVYKHNLTIQGFNLVKLHSPAKVLKMEDQNGTLRMWVEEDTDYISLPKRFKIVGTGHPIPEGFGWVASCQHGPFVWHLYQEAA